MRVSRSDEAMLLLTANCYSYTLFILLYFYFINTSIYGYIEIVFAIPPNTDLHNVT